MDIVHPEIDDYLNRTLPSGGPIMREMQRYAEAHDFPIVGPQVGRLLYVLARSVEASRVLELGSGFGYSGLWFAEAVGPGGRVVMTETSKTHAERAREYVKRAGMQSRTQIEVGNALDIITHLPGLFDVIFNDINKKDYGCTLDLVRPKLRPGGLFISDNMLWGGLVTGKSRSADLRGVKELTRALMSAQDFLTTIVPVGDGVAIALKRA